MIFDDTFTCIIFWMAHHNVPKSAVKFELERKSNELVILTPALHVLNDVSSSDELGGSSPKVCLSFSLDPVLLDGLFSSLFLPGDDLL